MKFFRTYQTHTKRFYSYFTLSLLASLFIANLSTAHEPTANQDQVLRQNRLQCSIHIKQALVDDREEEISIILNGISSPRERVFCINHVDQLGFSSVHVAVIYNRAKTLPILKKYGGNLDLIFPTLPDILSPQFARTSLDVAIMHHNVDMLLVLLTLGAKSYYDDWTLHNNIMIYFTPGQIAQLGARLLDVERLKYCLENTENIFRSNDPSQIDHWIQTLSKFGDLKEILNGKKDWNINALHIAAQMNATLAVLPLVAAGADLNLRTQVNPYLNIELTPDEYAATFGNNEFEKEIKSLRAYIEQRSPGDP